MQVQLDSALEPRLYLRLARKNAGFRSASSAAAQFGWNQSTYRAHESGVRNYNWDTARTYARAFGIDPRYIDLARGRHFDQTGKLPSWTDEVAENVQELSKVAVTSTAIHTSDFSVEVEVDIIRVRAELKVSDIPNLIAAIRVGAMMTR